MDSAKIAGESFSALGGSGGVGGQNFLNLSQKSTENWKKSEKST